MSVILILWNAVTVLFIQDGQMIHNAKKGAKYTRSRTPVKLVYLEKSDTREQAMRREAQIKRLSRHQKEQLIKDGKDLYGNNQI